MDKENFKASIKDCLNAIITKAQDTLKSVEEMDEKRQIDIMLSALDIEALSRKLSKIVGFWDL